MGVTYLDHCHLLDGRGRRKAREQARKSACLSNEKQIALAVSMYRQDWDSRGPFAGWPRSVGSQYVGPIDGVVYTPNFDREYTPWGNLAEYLVDPADGVPRHSGGSNVSYMDLHARWKRYGVGSGQKEQLQSVKDAFPFATTVDPGGVGPSVGIKDWAW